jgi:hypothetical protein
MDAPAQELKATKLTKALLVVLCVGMVLLGAAGANTNYLRLQIVRDYEETAREFPAGFEAGTDISPAAVRVLQATLQEDEPLKYPVWRYRAAMLAAGLAGIGGLLAVVLIIRTRQRATAATQAVVPIAAVGFAASKILGDGDFVDAFAWIALAVGMLVAWWILGKRVEALGEPPAGVVG